MNDAPLAAPATAVTLHWAVADTWLGPMLLAFRDGRICRLSFDEEPAALQRLFPRAELRPAGEETAALVARAAAAVEFPGLAHDLPLDLSGTPFQQAVWQALAQVPAGETVSYQELARRAGFPAAVRAAGTACGANRIAVLIPCHRARRGDGTPGGYAYGLHRKARLQARERGDLFD